MDFSWNFSDLLSAVSEQFDTLTSAIWEESNENGFLALVTPVDPFNRSDLLTPIVSAAGIITMIMLSGVAVGAMATLLAALMALYYVLTEVFGYELAVAPGAAPA